MVLNPVLTQVTVMLKRSLKGRKSGLGSLCAGALFVDYVKRTLILTKIKSSLAQITLSGHVTHSLIPTHQLQTNDTGNRY